MTMVRAPGKAMIFGEYAVLDGGPAIVAAVDRYVTARVTPRGTGPIMTSPSPFVEVAAQRARLQLSLRGRAAPPTTPVVDSSALYADGRRKLGLGSSAAVTVATYGAMLHAADVSLDDRLAIFEACDRAHNEAQGVRGSGADVAAAVYGGILRFQRQVESSPMKPIYWPRTISITLVDTGQPASTPDLVGRFRDLAARRPVVYRGLVERLADTAQAFCDVIETEWSIAGICEHVDSWNDLLEDISGYLETPLFTATHRRVLSIARQNGGTAKPSGAGGGDLAVCFVPSDDEEEFRYQLAASGLSILDVAIGAPGLCPYPLTMANKEATG